VKPFGSITQAAVAVGAATAYASLRTGFLLGVGQVRSCIL
jgi:hypothetical protein